MATVRVVKVSGSLATNGTVRVTKVSGVVATSNAKLRVVRINGAVGVKNIVRVTRVSGAITQTATMNDIAAQTVNSMAVVTITPSVVANGSTPSAYRYSLVPNLDVKSLPLTVATNTSNVMFYAPGRFNGCTVTIKVEALDSGSNVLGTKTATVTVKPHSTYVYQNGRWVAIKHPVKLTRA